MNETHPAFRVRIPFHVRESGHERGLPDDPLLTRNPMYLCTSHGGNDIKIHLFGGNAFTLSITFIKSNSEPHFQLSRGEASFGPGIHLEQLISSMAKEPSRWDQKSSDESITKELASCASNFLVKGDEAIDISLSLSDAGVESLVAIEIRDGSRQNLATIYY